MSDDSFYKFPHTPYLILPPKATNRQDKTLSDNEANQFFSEVVLVEEKIDGANLGISFRADGAIQLQNRGHRVEKPFVGQWEPLTLWLGSRTDALFDVLTDKYILFGEWCYVTHSIHYDNLPDWFIAFDVFDKNSHHFLAAKKRNEIVNEAGLAVVPLLFEGRISRDLLDRLIGKSAFGKEKCEGLYFRIDSSDYLLHRAKYVRNDFSQSIDTHWRKKRVVHNQLSV